MRVPEGLTITSLDNTGLDTIKKILGIYAFEAVLSYDPHSFIMSINLVLI